MKCQPNCAPGGTLSNTRLSSCFGGILAGSTWRILASRSGSILAGYSAGSTGKGYSAGYSAGSTGELLWWDSRRDPLARCSGILSGILGGIFTGGLFWQDTRRDPLASYSGELLWRDTRRALAGLGGIHWRAALAGYSARSTGELLWRDTGWGRCRSIANADSNIKTNNPFLLGGEAEEAFSSGKWCE